jgi:hypothetical protein
LQRVEFFDWNSHLLLIPQVPMVPFLPAISIFINIYLMLMLDYYTWIRFGVWMILGKPNSFVAWLKAFFAWNSHLNPINSEPSKV